jgi:Domain of unknown function (DUF6484)
MKRISVEDATADTAGSEPVPMSLPSALVGTILAVHGKREAQVEFRNPGSTMARARSTADLAPGFVGASVALLFENAEPDRPIIIGILSADAYAADSNAPAATTEIRVDGERLMFNAEKEISLRCGASSITLTRAGKVLIQGAYVSSRSSGTHRIKGASVQIN